MKKQLLIVFMSSLISALSYATDCQHSPENYICPGDSIVTESRQLGTALGVNPYTHMIAYEYQTNSQQIFKNTKSADTFFVTYGCSFGICVGDSIISSENYSGTVIGVNFYTGKVAFEYVSVSNQSMITDRDPRTLASSKFCEKYGPSERSAERFPFFISMP